MAGLLSLDYSAHTKVFHLVSRSGKRPKLSFPLYNQIFMQLSTDIRRHSTHTQYYVFKGFLFITEICNSVTIGNNSFPNDLGGGQVYIVM